MFAARKGDPPPLHRCYVPVKMALDNAHAFLANPLLFSPKNNILSTVKISALSSILVWPSSSSPKLL